jgi:hypothetical protein
MANTSPAGSRSLAVRHAAGQSSAEISSPRTMMAKRTRFPTTAPSSRTVFLSFKSAAWCRVVSLMPVVSSAVGAVPKARYAESRFPQWFSLRPRARRPRARAELYNSACSRTRRSYSRFVPNYFKGAGVLDAQPCPIDAEHGTRPLGQLSKAHPRAQARGDGLLNCRGTSEASGSGSDA